jgi:prepilin-type N-terminal cleavage/methylation domain-containing protein
MRFLKNNQFGVTMIELLIAIAIIGIMTSIAVVRISLTDDEVLRQATEQTAADLKQIRNLAASRVINENSQYPEGGYGIFFQDKMLDDPAYYVLFADNGHEGFQDYTCRIDPGSCPSTCSGYCDADIDTFVPDSIIKKHIYNEDLEISMHGLTNDHFFYTFQTEHTATTTYSGVNSFNLDINYPSVDTYSVLIADENPADDYVFGSIFVHK